MTAVADTCAFSPMLCPSCNKVFDEPRLLPCLHSVCIGCLNKDKTRCPICKGFISPLPEIPSDMLLEYLMSNKHTLEGVPCANCDKSHSIETMLFCNTCSQPLCGRCRDATHSAKMFSKHDIVDILSKRLNKQRFCSLHNEPFIMYNAEDKSLVCISCFREIGLSKRTHCLDIESAYSSVQNALCKSIEYTTTTQGALLEALGALDAMIADINDTSKKRLEEIQHTYTNITRAVELCNQRLVEDCTEHTHSCLQTLREKQERLKQLLPILHSTLKAADLFSSVADRFDLVELGTYVIERLQSLTSKVTQLQPLNDISDTEMLDYRKEFTECLGLTLSDKKNTDKLHDSIRAELIAYHRGISRSSGPGSMYSKQLEHKAVHIDELQRCLNTYKNQVQELHRDITIRRSSAGANKTAALTGNCEGLLEIITTETTELKQLQPLLENSWKETLNSVVKQQERYKDRMSVVEKMRNETQYLITMVKQLTPFIHNYKAVSAKIHPKLGSSSSAGPNGQSSLDNMHQIIQTIKEITPDSDQRIAAIEQAEREKSGSKKSKSTLEEDLLKQKGKLRSVVNSSEDLSML